MRGVHGRRARVLGTAVGLAAERGRRAEREGQARVRVRGLGERRRARGGPLRAEHVDDHGGVRVGVGDDGVAV